jgi:hypothetical protein
MQNTLHHTVCTIMEAAAAIGVGPLQAAPSVPRSA